ncbi:MAG: Clp protease N-terminal domain-containing protein, partial [Cyanobacteriota bacterium]
MPAEAPTHPTASLTATPERFSDAAWDLFLPSQEQARRWRHGAMDVEHLLLALLLDGRFAPWVDRLPLEEDRLLDRLEAFCADQPASADSILYIGDALEDLLEEADRRRAGWGDRRIEIPHLLLALLTEPRLGGALLAGEGLSDDLLTRQWRPGGPSARPEGDAAVPEPPARPPVGPADRGAAPAGMGPAREETLRLERLGSEEEGRPEGLSLFGRDLTAAARNGELDPVIGRDTELRRLIQVLSRRGKNNPVLIGEPGVGKTAVAELLAQRIVAGEVPEALRGVRLVALDLGALIAGAKFRGQFEERLRGVLEEVRDAEGRNGGVVLF